VAHLDKAPGGFAVAGLATMGLGVMAGLAILVVALLWGLGRGLWRRRMALVALILVGLQLLAVLAFWAQVPDEIVFDRVHLSYDVGWGFSSLAYLLALPMALALLITSWRAADVGALRPARAAAPVGVTGLDLERARALAAAPLPAYGAGAPLPPPTTPLPPMQSPTAAPFGMASGDPFATSSTPPPAPPALWAPRRHASAGASGCAAADAGVEPAAAQLRGAADPARDDAAAAAAGRRGSMEPGGRVAAGGRAHHRRVQRPGHRGVGARDRDP
jgi:hypothetical protein